jgi:carbonic anhydrase/acetyltransferase-like protein (isoleucine patch superfamily)
MVMGMPGKVIRQLNQAEIQGLTASAAHYQDAMRRFRGGLAVKEG